MILCLGCANPDDTNEEIDRPVAEIPEIVCVNAALAREAVAEDRRTV
jgi:hypothetical protein